MRLFLGVDGGSSSIRLRFVDGNGAVVRPDAGLEFREGGTNLLGNHAEEAVIARLEAAIAESKRRIGFAEGDAIAGVAIGTAGIDLPGDDERFLAVFRQCHALRDVPVTVVSDVDIIAECSHEAVRICVIAGTGANCRAMRYSDAVAVPLATVRIGGIDMPLSDWGSAARIGLAAAQHALDAAMEFEPAGSLAPAVFDYLGLTFPEQWARLKDAYRADRASKAAMARLALVVDRCAIGGDPAAIGILQAAAGEIVRSVTTGMRRLGVGTGESAAVLCVGSVLLKNRIVRSEVERRVRAWYPGARFEDADPSLGAALMARRAWSGAGHLDPR